MVAKRPWVPKNVGVTILVRASGRGRGIMLYLPVAECEVWDIKSGDKVQIYIRKRFREHYHEDKGEVKDLSENLGRPPKEKKWDEEKWDDED